MDRIILYSILAVCFNGYFLSPEPWIEVKEICTSKLNVACSVASGSYGWWTFHWIPNGETVWQNIAKVLFNEYVCNATYLRTIDMMQCICIPGTGVSCYISEERIGKAGDKWKCSQIEDGHIYFSKATIVPGNEETNPCPTASAVENFTDIGSTVSGILENGVKHVTDTANTSTVVDENNITAESATITTTRNANNTAEIYREETNDKDETMSNRHLMIIMSVVGVAIVIGTNASICTYWQMKTRPRAMSNRHLMIIMSVVGVAIVIGTNASICTYWKMKTRPREANYNITKIDNTIAELQTSTMILSDIETTTEENTHVHYYEIDDTSSQVSYGGSVVPNALNTRAAIDRFENIPQVQYENIAQTSATELSNIIQIYTMEQQDNTVQTHAIDMNNSSQIPCKLSTENIASTSNSSNTFRTAQVRGGFMTLADINIFDGVVADSDDSNDSPRHSAILRTDTECSHYENLDQTGRDVNSQYTSLV